MGLAEGINAGSNFHNVRIGRKRLESELKKQQSAERIKLTESINSNINDLMVTVGEIIGHSKTRNISDDQIGLEIKPIIDQAISLSQGAEKNGLPVTSTSSIRAKLQSFMSQPSQEFLTGQENDKLKEKETIKAEVKDKFKGAQPTKAVFNKETGRKEFATDEMISKNPSLFPITEAKTNSFQQKIFVNPLTGESIRGSFRNDGVSVDEQNNLIPEGFLPTNITTQITAEDVGLTTKSQGLIEEDIIQAKDRISRLKETRKKYKPEFLTFGGKIKKGFISLKDKAPEVFGKLSSQEKKFLEEYSVFAQTSIEDLNRTIQEMTGAQMSEFEANRLRKQSPDPENNSPTQFLANLDSALIMTELALARKTYMLKNGIEHDFNSTEEPPVTLESMKDIMRKRANELAIELKDQNPDIDDNAIIQESVRRTRTEFGL